MDASFTMMGLLAIVVVGVIVVAVVIGVIVAVVLASSASRKRDEN
jgi:hypothetical protein